MVNCLDVYSIFDEDGLLIKRVAFYGKSQIKKAWDGYEY